MLLSSLLSALCWHLGGPLKPNYGTFSCCPEEAGIRLWRCRVYEQYLAIWLHADKSFQILGRGGVGAAEI